MQKFTTTTVLVGILSRKNKLYFDIKRYLTSRVFSLIDFNELVDFCNWTVCLPYEEAFEAVWNYFPIEHSQEYIQMVSSGISPDTYYQLCKNATLEQIDPNYQFVDTVIGEGEAEQTLSNILKELPFPLNDFRLPALQEIYVALLSTSQEGRASVLKIYEAYINQTLKISCISQNDINNVNAEIADILENFSNRLKYTEKEATAEIVESVRTAEVTRAEIIAGSSTVLDLETEMEKKSSYSEEVSIVSTSNQVAAAAGSGAGFGAGSGSGSKWLIYLLIFFIITGGCGIIFYIWPRGQDSQIKKK
uniref:Uncharacterized protein n=1 Tax=Halimeda discoidea TaxID=118222 RepID=A0A1C9JB35_9CHLO|nr:hypothetical protein [Halimeda discoidea]